MAELIKVAAKGNVRHSSSALPGLTPQSMHLWKRFCEDDGWRGS